MTAGESVANPVSAAQPPAARSPLRYRSFTLLVLGRAMATAGNTAAPIALAFAVLDLTDGSLIDLGFVVGMRSLTNLALLLVGGVVADRWSRRTILSTTMVLAGAAQAAVALLAFAGLKNIALLAVLAALNGAFSSFSFPAGQALVPQTVPVELRRRANALNRLATQSSTIISSVAGAALVAAFGSAAALAVVAAAFVAAAVLYLGVRAPDRPPSARVGAVAELRVGWLEVVTRRWVLVIVVGFAVFNCAFLGVSQVIGPAMVGESFGRRAWGVVVGVRAAGTIVGAIVALRTKVRRSLLFGSACMLAQVPFLVALTGSNLLVLLAAALLSGLGVEQFAVAWDTALQRYVPAEALGRVYAYDAFASYLAIPVGQLGIGPVTSALGPTATVLLAAAIATAAVGATVASRPVRRLDTLPPAP